MKDTRERCPICNGIVNSSTQDLNPHLFRVDCPRCGKYEITESALAIYNASEQTDKGVSVSYWIHKNQSGKDNQYILINDSMIGGLITPFTPLRPMEQVNNFLLWLGGKIRSISDSTTFPILNLIPIMGCCNPSDVLLIIDHLYHEKFIHKSIETLPNSDIRAFRGGLTFKGWEKYYELRRTNIDSRLAFMAMKYGQEPLETLFGDIIKPAVDETRFEIRKLTEEKRAGLIDDKLRVEIRRSKFLIADLTHDNNGAYWEAGYAEGLGMPVIYICEKKKFESQKSHFDTNHHLTVQWEDDPTTWKEFAEELKATIRATFPAEAKMED